MSVEAKEKMLIFCLGCGNRICFLCPSISCERCDEFFYCDICFSDNQFCVKCQEDDEDGGIICFDCCDGHDEQEEVKVDTVVKNEGG